MIEHFPFILSLPVLSDVEGSKHSEALFQQPAKVIPNGLFKFSIQYIDRHLTFPLDELLMKDNRFAFSQPE